MKKLIFIIVILFTLSCTENERARNFGGTETIQLKEGEKFINMTWKGTDLWILTEPNAKNTNPKTYEFNEKSSFGYIQGKIIIKEK